MNRFDYLKYDDKAVKQQGDFKQLFQKLEQLIEESNGVHTELMKRVGILESTRAKELVVQNIGHLFNEKNLAAVMTALEQGYMWVGKAIRDDQFARNGTAPLQEERSES